MGEIHHISDGILHIYFVPEKTATISEIKVVMYIDGDWEYYVDGTLKLYKRSRMDGPPKDWFWKWENFANRNPLGYLSDVSVEDNGELIRLSFSNNQELLVKENNWGGVALSQEIDDLLLRKKEFVHDRLDENLTNFEHIQVKTALP